ncbi:MAG: phosphoribosyltransferase family protein [Planctomycetota bacterium]
MAASIARVLRAWEETWLSPTTLPARERLARSGWEPDEADSYCDRCGATLGAYEGDEFGCASCRDRRVPWARFVRLGAFDEPLDEWVRSIKFGRDRAMGRALGRMLGESLQHAGATDGLDGGCVLVPVPMHWRRRVSRGIEHARVLARSASAVTGVPTECVLRKSSRETQRGRSLEARKRNIKGAMRARGRIGEAQRVVLIDDVATSGETLREGVRALRARFGQDLEVWIGVVAVTAEPSRRRAIEVGQGGQGVDEMVVGG